MGQIDLKVAGEVAVSHRPLELAIGPKRLPVRQLARQLVRWRPRNRQRNDGVELRQVLSLQLKLALQTLDFKRDDGAGKAHIGCSRSGMQNELIGLVYLAQRGETQPLDRKS